MTDGAHPIFIGVGGSHAARARGQVGHGQGDQAGYAVGLTAPVLRVAILTHANRGDVLATRDRGLVCGDSNWFNRYFILFPTDVVPLHAADNVENYES